MFARLLKILSDNISKQKSFELNSMKIYKLLQRYSEEGKHFLGKYVRLFEHIVRTRNPTDYLHCFINHRLEDTFFLPITFHINKFLPENISK